MWEGRKRQELNDAARLGRNKIYDRWITILQEPREDEGIFFLMDRKRRIDLIVVNCKLPRLNPRRKHGNAGGSWRRGRNLLMGFVPCCLTTYNLWSLDGLTGKTVCKPFLF
jgi:hypothetical protein